MRGGLLLGAADGRWAMVLGLQEEREKEEKGKIYRRVYITSYIYGLVIQDQVITEGKTTNFLE